MTLRTGDLVTYKMPKADGKYNLGMVIRVNWMQGLVKIRWCDGSISLHAEMFLKRIA